jgi:signal transduction histidine kinase
MAFMPDGRLLVATVASGLAVLDTHRIQMASGSQSSFIDEFMVDGQSVPLAPEPQVHGRRFQFLFTAPNINAADSSLMYYRLDGVDTDWIEAREDRRAIYALLRPGEYRFRVKAAGATSSASLTFRIPPRLFETAYFPVLVLCALGLTGWGIYLLRVRQIEAGMRLVFEERLRVTREMHDGLLQGFTAVAFQLDTAVRQFDRAPEECRRRLKNALEQADSSMQEARHAISLLRLPALENQLLSAALDKMGKQVTEGLGGHFSSNIESADSLPYTVQASLYVIARELISNAATHASASRIELRVECTEQSFCLVVEDNGKGFESTQVDPQAGHIGLASVRERARLIDATVTIDSKPGKGTLCSISGRRIKK